jgi:hypothetical protein
MKAEKKTEPWEAKAPTPGPARNPAEKTGSASAPIFIDDWTGPGVIGVRSSIGKYPVVGHLDGGGRADVYG